PTIGAAAPALEIRIVSSGPQTIVGPTIFDVSHSVCTGPPAIATRFSLPAAMNAMLWLSGDQIGAINVLSVPVRARISSESSRRTHTRAPLTESRAIATDRPSGETANGAAPMFHIVPSGSGIANRTTWNDGRSLQ